MFRAALTAPAKDPNLLIMSIFSRLFGPKGSGSGDLEARLKKLEAEAETAGPAYVGTAYNRAGDVALRGEQRDRAVSYYGRAIDAFLQDGQREAARGVANKIIRVRPTAVRTLCTLTWLDLAARHSATALLHLRDYVDAAKAIDRTGIAANQIYEMAKIAPDEEFIAAVADALDVLDYGYLGEEVRGWVKSGSPDVVADSVELADACLHAAIKSNERGEQAKEAPPPPEKKKGKR